MHILFFITIFGLKPDLETLILFSLVNRILVFPTGLLALKTTLCASYLYSLINRGMNKLSDLVWDTWRLEGLSTFVYSDSYIAFTTANGFQTLMSVPFYYPCELEK